MSILRPESRQPIPSHAKRVFRGKLFDVYQWKQALFDGKSTTFEKLRRPDTVYVLPIDQDGRLTILEQSQPGSRPFTGLVGGRLENQETPEDCARRELLEETGLAPASLTLWAAFQFLPKIDWAIYVFIAHNCRLKSLPKPDGGEKITAISVSLEELIDVAAQDRFGDVEIALLLLRTAQDTTKMAELRRIVHDQGV